MFGGPEDTRHCCCFSGLSADPGSDREVQRPCPCGVRVVSAEPGPGRERGRAGGQGGFLAPQAAARALAAVADRLSPPADSNPARGAPHQLLGAWRRLQPGSGGPGRRRPGSGPAQGSDSQYDDQQRDLWDHAGPEPADATAAPPRPQQRSERCPQPRHASDGHASPSA